MKKFGFIFFTVCVSFFSQHVFAADSTECSVNSTMIPSGGRVIVTRDMQVGTLLGTFVKEGTIYTKCISTYDTYNREIGIKSYGVDSGQRVGNKIIYKTTVPGIGYALAGKVTSISGGFTCPSSDYVFVGENTNVSAGAQNEALICRTGKSNKQMGALTGGFKIEIYKIGDVLESSNGFIAPIANIGAATYYFAGGVSNSKDREAPLAFDGLAITFPACKVESQSLDFPMGTVLMDQFHGIGSTSSKFVTQNLGLFCEPNARIYATLEGQPSADVNDNSVLALTNEGGEGVASGIGVQLSYGETVFKIGERLMLRDNSVGEKESLPLTVRYYQTKERTTAGSADATATLSITYQ